MCHISAVTKSHRPYCSAGNGLNRSGTTTGIVAMKRVTKPLGVCLLLLATSFQAIASKTSDAYKKAMVAYENKKLDTAFDAITESILNSIRNKDALAAFPSIGNDAYAKINRDAVKAESEKNWDGLVVVYDRIMSMNTRTTEVVRMVNERYYGKRKNKIPDITDKIIALKTVDVSAKRKAAAEEAAAAHYEKAQTFVEQQNDRMAQREFTAALEFVPSYKDARELAAKHKDLADEKEAAILYDSASAQVEMTKLREAVTLFVKADSLKKGFRDARGLADRYKLEADSADAASHYEAAVQCMKKEQYKEAYDKLQMVNTFVPGFQDSQVLLKQCMDKLPPNAQQIQVAVSKSLAGSVPVSWVGNLMGGSNAKLSTIEVAKVGIYNGKLGYWPMKVHVVGSCALQDPFNPGKTVSFDKVGEFKFTRDDYGEWVAELADGMFQ